MSDNIIYEIDSNGNRVSVENWTGSFHEDSTADNLWLRIFDRNQESVQLTKGSIIHYSSGELEFEGIFIIEECHYGIFKVKKFTII